MKDFFFKVDRHDGGRALLSYLYEKLTVKDLSKKQLKALIEKGICGLNGKVERFASKKLKAGDLLIVSCNWQKPLQRTRLKFSVLYEDENILAVDKPLGFVCTNENLHRYFSREVELAHRLDKGTTGVLLLAKKKIGLDAMIELFKKRKIKKYYLAVVDGALKGKGKIEAGLKLQQRKGGGVVYAVGKNEDKALTFYNVVKTGEEFSCVLCRIVTGKTHQIRAHFAHLKHPLLGDYAYCKSFRYKGFASRLMLHSYFVAFEHPFEEKQIEIKSRAPQDFFEFLTQKEIASIMDGVWNDF